MEWTDFTTIGRPIDLEYPTNRAIVILTLIITVLGALWGTSLLWGIQAGLTIFLTWALCRELDPDHPMGAFVAVALHLPLLYLWDLPQLTIILWLLIVARVLNRTAGLPAGILDAMGLLGLAGWLALDGNWGYGAVTALALFLDSRLPHPARRQLIFALLAVLGTGAVALRGGAPMGQGAPSLAGGLIALALSLAFLPVALATRHVESVGDQTGEPLSPLRVQAAQLLVLLASVELALVGGIATVRAITPLWAATLAADLTWLYNALRS